ncbi:hypothetical protein SAMN05878426_102536 [Phaeovulum vinaykumarii]|uniref:Uncharacterized protein n=1 Tax=Phaeovulum vinaykumarii TaxID=407234 RepID=A0A1N7KW69_9RHOB|nr:hypothetical protein SAMN05421795_102236 [Phaeovulum vinaykumarii]SOC01170.1 hypothetical protein SAMN05878426_102536 [Phaeovulum vinaykumarii]
MPGRRPVSRPETAGLDGGLRGRADTAGLGLIAPTPRGLAIAAMRG